MFSFCEIHASIFKNVLYLLPYFREEMERTVFLCHGKHLNMTAL